MRVLGPLAASVLRQTMGVMLTSSMMLSCVNLTFAAEVIALGASNTYGKGVERGEDFPARLEQFLHAKGLTVTVTNAGINGDTTASMLSRLDGLIGSDTKVLLLQPGGNDQRRGGNAAETQANITAIREKLTARRIKLVMVPNVLGRSPGFAGVGTTV